jgi:hypothetical protein
MMAVTESLMPAEDPKCDATSLMTAVITPIMMMHTKKAAWPLTKAVYNQYKNNVKFN